MPFILLASLRFPEFRARNGLTLFLGESSYLAARRRHGRGCRQRRRPEGDSRVREVTAGTEIMTARNRIHERKIEGSDDNIDAQVAGRGS